jgi:hypothetical protein
VLDTRERLRQISLEAGMEVEDGVDSAAQVHVDERESSRNSSLVKRLAQRFESARRLSPWSLYLRAAKPLTNASYG